MPANTATSQSDSLAAAAPDPARSAAKGFRRASALAAIVAVVGALGALSVFAWRHRPDSSGLAAPPFALSESTRRAVLTVATVADRSCPASSPVAILYVSSTCTHCKAELERWSKLVRAKSPTLSCIGIAVVAAPTGPASNASWLPAALSSSLLWDHDHAIARELGVRLVPLAAFVTRTGIVISKSIGEVSEESTAQQLSNLRRVATTITGVHKNE